MSDNFELAIERHFDIPPQAFWTALADHLTIWWCPKPWTTEIIEWDLRPSGTLHLRMCGPDGETSDVSGVFLEVSAPHRMVFTDAFKPGWQPQIAFMTGIFRFADDEAGGTLYRASARHWTAEARDSHIAMGFEHGWGMVADQLHEVARQVAYQPKA